MANIPVVAQGTVTDFETAPRATRLWLPDGISSVRGLIVQGNPFNGDARGYIDNQALRGFARFHEFGLLATAFWGRFQDDEIQIWEQHLAAHAVLSGHEEIVNAPWVALGMSNGGQMAYGLNALRPEKTIAFCVNKGGYYIEPVPSESALLTPGMLVAGELDEPFRRAAIRGLFEYNRPRGARWAWVEEQRTAHEGDAERLFLPFLSECVDLRYPSGETPSATDPVSLVDLPETSGWLADPGSWNEPLTVIASYDTYSGEPSMACWLPNESCAYMYCSFATRAANLTVSGGVITGRDFFILQPGFMDYWTDIPVDGTESATMEIDTSAEPYWQHVQIFSGADTLTELFNTGLMQPRVTVPVTLVPGIHSLSARITAADGTTIHTTGQRHRVVLPAPANVPVAGGWSLWVIWAGLTLLLLFSRHR